MNFFGKRGRRKTNIYGGKIERNLIIPYNIIPNNMPNDAPK